MMHLKTVLPSDVAPKPHSSTIFTRCAVVLLAGLFSIALSHPSALAQQHASAVHAKDGFWLERRGVVERSDIILQRPNVKPSEAMPLGNGRLGVAVWAEDGLTAQLNRADTLPARLSPGQVYLPGLKKLTQSPDYQGRLNLYDGELTQRGGSMRATAYLDESLDVLVIDVKGADPKQEQTATLQLWQPRKPHALANGAIGVLAETWIDDKEAGASHERFGSLAAITADALNVRSTTDNELTVTLAFFPRADGSFHLFVASPSWRDGDAVTAAAHLLASASRIGADEHRLVWHRFWEHAALFKLSSPDHAAEYFENLRAIDLFTSAAESRDRFPGSQAGIGDLFASNHDEHKWGPSAYWHWNLRMQVSANLSAGVADLNLPYFRLYRENLDNILDWTRKHMAGRPGVCVPETMRFNGRGYENETWLSSAPINCGEDSPPYYNARTISTGAEVSLWVLDQFEYTGDLEFLKNNYPLLRESARFLLAYGKPDERGVLHTDPSNSHETQWDVRDPVTDVSAMRAFFPRFVQAAALLKTDAELALQVEAHAAKLPEFPLVSLSAPHALLAPAASLSDTVIANSHTPEAEIHNTENNGLEPVWPYALIGDDGPLHPIAVRTYLNRPNKNVNDWSFDPVQAARLGLADEFRASLLALTERYQEFPSGLAGFMGPEFYVEQVGVVADAVQKALADDYNGLIRIAPAWPKDWDADGTVYLRHRNKANVRIRNGQLVHLELEAGVGGPVRIRNPWPGKEVRVVAASNPQQVLTSTQDPVLAFNASAGAVYRIQRAADANTQAAFEPASGLPASTPKKLGSRTIGLAK